ncbi:MAG: LON peptidase substrate-binding domain-containing protein [Bacteroidota bacterium]
MSLLPLFPLGVVVLPGQLTQLHIFEPRYKQLFAECQASEVIFGIPFILNGKLSEYGTTARLEGAVTKYKTGEMDVTIRGLDIIRIDKFYDRHPLKLYPAGTVTELSSEVYRADMKTINEFKKFAFRYLPKEKLSKTISGSIFELAGYLGLTEEQKYNILTMFNPDQMNRLLKNIIRTKSALMNQESHLQGNYYLN